MNREPSWCVGKVALPLKRRVIPMIQKTFPSISLSALRMWFVSFVTQKANKHIITINILTLIILVTVTLNTRL